ncbi:hypothetical protein ACTXG7_19610 [Mycolicibacterium sp. Dal123E01]|uniref:hypothetical protein n=1 Tax=Mycolicibacterium sp. Dal123E01 TaxID=3457578 RepID=UPI00403E7542
MASRTHSSRVGGTLLAMAIATGAGAIGTAPAANASCTSVFGFGNTANCHSSFGSIAIAVSSTSFAQADGLFGLAFASGTNAGAVSFGILGAAISVGTNAQTGVGSGREILQLGNVAIDFGNHSGALNAVIASGLGNVAANFGGTDVYVFANGAFNSTTNLSGSFNEVSSSGFLTSAFAFQSRNTHVNAGTGAFALAGSFLQNGAALEQAPFGININGAGFPPSAAASKAALRNNKKPVVPKPKSSTSATAKPSKKDTARSARG